MQFSTTSKIKSKKKTRTENLPQKLFSCCRFCYNQFILKYSTMKIVPLLILFLVVFCPIIESVFYNFVSFENCTTSNFEFAELETCESSRQTGINFTMNIKRPMSKILVSYKSLTFYQFNNE